jgi:TRAP-type C4-dicarboxylate transport system permease large subunit
LTNLPPVAPGLSWWSGLDGATRSCLTIGNGIGLDPMQLDLMLVVSLSIGPCTPRVGTTLFISAGIARVGIGETVEVLLPF